LAISNFESLPAQDLEIQKNHLLASMQQPPAVTQPFSFKRPDGSLLKLITLRHALDSDNGDEDTDHETAHKKGKWREKQKGQVKKGKGKDKRTGAGQDTSESEWEEEPLTSEVPANEGTSILPKQWPKPRPRAAAETAATDITVTENQEGRGRGIPIPNHSKDCPTAQSFLTSR
jgi:hypothetical protein